MQAANRADLYNLKDKFNLFEKANENTISLSFENAEDFPINQRVFQRWIAEFRRRVGVRSRKKLDSAETTEELLDWVDRFERNFAYVDKKTFLQALDETIAWVRSLIAGKQSDNRVVQLDSDEEETPLYDYVILTTEKKTLKGGVWITLFAWPLISDIVTHVLDQNDVNRFLASKESAFQQLL